MEYQPLKIRTEQLSADSFANGARFAGYFGVVAQVNGSLIEEVNITGRKGAGPETTSPDGRTLTLGARSLPPINTARPAAVAAWTGASLHGFAHSRYSPRTDEPLRALLDRKLHRTWNMIEDARIERLLLRDFPGWQPHLMAACSYILLKDGNMAGVYPLLVGRTYMPADLRRECYEAFAAEHSNYIADAVGDLVRRYMMLVDPGSADVDETMSIVKTLRSLLGEYGSDCGSSEVESTVQREWSDPGDPNDDDDDDDADGDDGNHSVTDDADGDDDADDDADGDDADGDDDTDDDGADGDDDTDGDGADGDDDTDDDDADGDGADGDDGDGGEAGGDEGADEGSTTADDGSDSSSLSGESVAQSASRLADWSEAIASAVEADERLRDAAEAVASGPIPFVELPQRACQAIDVRAEVVLAEEEIARELRVVMDGVRPGMRRRIDRGRFNVARVVREGGSTRPEEMFDRHDPGALRSTGVAVATLVDISGSMGEDGVIEAMESLWSIERAVHSVRGTFKGWTFGTTANELPTSNAGEVWVPLKRDGGTDPSTALASAASWVGSQRQPNRLCIIATDGGWERMEQCESMINSMLASGAQVAVFGIAVRPDILRNRFMGVPGVSLATIGSAADLGPAVGQMLVGRVRSAAIRR